MPEHSPRRIADRYLLQEELGRGGIGIVWRATDELLRRQVAVKEISFPRALSEEHDNSLKTRVLREAQAAAGINHPGVVAVYDILQSDERAFIVMELIEAPTLADLVKDQGPLSPARAAAVGLDLLETLRIAHSAGIVHRDVKPANVMVPSEGQAKLADFGIASLQNDPRLTASGIILGSPAFMAPEQAHESSSSPATDMWGLGATLFFAVHGEPPFDKGQAIPTLTAVLSEEPQITAEAGALGPVIEALLHKDPALRPGPEEAQRSLTEVAEGGPGGSTQVVTMGDPSGVPSQVERETVAPRTETRESRADDAAPLMDETGGRRLLIGLGLLAAAALIAVLLFTGGEDDPSPRDGREKRGAQVEKGNDQEGPASPTEDADEEEAPATEDDPELATYTDPSTGYVVGIPPSWTTTPRAENRTDFVSPSGAYLRTEWTDTPGDDVLGTLTQIYGDFATRKSDYNEIAIEPVEFQDFDAAQAEYTYSEDGVTLHAVNLQFVTGEYGFALNFQTHEDEWEELLPTFEAIKASFQAP